MLRLLIDCDGVLANFIDAALEQLSCITEHSYTHDQVLTWDVFNSLPAHEHLRDAVYARMKAPGGCARIPPYAGAKAGLSAIHALGVDIVAVTAPFRGSETWMHERERWLHDHFGIDRLNVVQCSRKELVTGDILVDDKVENVLDWTRAHPKGLGLLWTQQYNIGHGTKLPSVGSWAELGTIVRNFKPVYEQRIRVR